MSKINNMLADAAGLTEQQTAAMADGDWQALSDRLNCDDPPESDLRACLAYQAAARKSEIGRHCEREVENYERRRELETEFSIAQATQRELETELAECRVMAHRHKPEPETVHNAPACPKLAKKIREACLKIVDSAAVAGGVAPSPMLKAAAEAEEKRVKRARHPNAYVQHVIDTPITITDPMGGLCKVIVPEPTFECRDCPYCGVTHPLDTSCPLRPGAR